MPRPRSAKNGEAVEIDRAIHCGADHDPHQPARARRPAGGCAEVATCQAPRASRPAAETGDDRQERPRREVDHGGQLRPPSCLPPHSCPCWPHSNFRHYSARLVDRGPAGDHPSPAFCEGPACRGLERGSSGTASTSPGVGLEAVEEVALLLLVFTRRRQTDAFIQADLGRAGRGWVAGAGKRGATSAAFPLMSAVITVARRGPRRQLPGLPVRRPPPDHQAAKLSS